MGSDVYDLYRVVDTIARNFGTGGQAAAARRWLVQDMVGMYSFRLADSKPSWMLSYSWGNEKQVVPGEAMKNGRWRSSWPGRIPGTRARHVGLNDIETRKASSGG